MSRESQKSLKQQLKNTSLHLNAARQIVDEHEIPVGGGGGSEVVPSEEPFQGAPTAEALVIDGKPYNMPGGEGTTVVPSSEPYSDGTLTGCLTINGKHWNMPQITASEKPVPKSDLMASITINNKSWNISTRRMHISLNRDPERPMTWTGKLTKAQFSNLISGYNVEWYFDSDYTLTTSEFAMVNDQVAVIAEGWDTNTPGYRFYGLIEADAMLEEHNVVFIFTEYSTEALTERPEEPVLAKGLKINGVNWVFENTGGSTVIPHTQAGTGAQVARSLAIDGVIWNMPTGSGGEGGEAVWGGITGNINDQTDLMNKLNDFNTRITNAQNTANSAKSRADKAYDKAEDAQDDADYADQKADGAIAEASAVAGGLAAVEWQIQNEILASISSLSGQIATKASRSSVDALEDRLKAVEDRVEAMAERLDGMDNRVRELWAFIDNDLKPKFTFVIEPANKEE